MCFQITLSSVVHQVYMRYTDIWKYPHGSIWYYHHDKVLTCTYLLLRVWHNSLQYQNIENRGIVFCGTPISQICTKPWKIMVRNYHPSGNKLISLYHEFSWDLLIGSPIYHYPYSSYLTSPYQPHLITILKTSVKYPSFDSN